MDMGCRRPIRSASLDQDTASHAGRSPSLCPLWKDCHANSSRVDLGTPWRPMIELGSELRPGPTIRCPNDRPRRPFDDGRQAVESVVAIMAVLPTRREAWVRACYGAANSLTVGTTEPKRWPATSLRSSHPTQIPLSRLTIERTTLVGRFFVERQLGRILWQRWNLVGG